MPYGQTWQGAELDESIGKTTRALPGGFYVSLHTAFPGFDGQSGNEVSGGSYARKQVLTTQWDSAIVGDKARRTLNTTLSFVTATADWGTITHVGFWKTLAGTGASDFLGWFALTSPENVTSGRTVRLQSGQIYLSYA